MNFRDFFEYKDGTLFYKKHRHKSRVGAPAGTLNKTSEYIIVSLMRARYCAHRVIWEIVNGPIPTGKEIDHINRIKTDNRIENLRLCSRNQNLANAAKMKPDKAGSRFKGIYVVKDGRRKKFKARIKFHKKTIHIGAFECEAEAATAYNQRAKELFGEFAWLNEVAVG